ncbi:MAG TPA: hypothetical protein PK467_00405 [Candidatus Wallbacteria bacterium]|nr:hypothetical protein [Candidatus Wallbacteria bacterium]
MGCLIYTIKLTDKVYGGRFCFEFNSYGVKPSVKLSSYQTMSYSSSDPASPDRGGGHSGRPD